MKERAEAKSKGESHRELVTATDLDNLTLHLKQEIHVRASLDATFEALLEQMGPGNETPDGSAAADGASRPFPGGRWFRDLGDDDGHFWGHVQAIKRPTLLEITGPLFMSMPVISNLQYRLNAGRRRDADRVPALGVRLRSRPVRRAWTEAGRPSSTASSATRKQAGSEPIDQAPDLRSAPDLQVGSL